MTAVPVCAAWCPVVTLLVINEARREGVSEAVVRQQYGLNRAAADAAEVLTDLLDRMPVTDDPRGWLDAELHRIRTTLTGAPS